MGSSVDFSLAINHNSRAPECFGGIAFYSSLSENSFIRTVLFWFVATSTYSSTAAARRCISVLFCFLLQVRTAAACRCIFIFRLIINQRGYARVFPTGKTRRAYLSSPSGSRYLPSWSCWDMFARRKELWSPAIKNIGEFVARPLVELRVRHGVYYSSSVCAYEK